jgi:hypothetical protein
MGAWILYSLDCPGFYGCLDFLSRSIRIENWNAVPSWRMNDASSGYQYLLGSHASPRRPCASLFPARLRTDDLQYLPGGTLRWVSASPISREPDPSRILQWRGLGECHGRGRLPSRSEGKFGRHLDSPAPETVRARRRVRSDGSVRFRQMRKVASPARFVRSRPRASDKSTRGTDGSRETKIPILPELPANVPLHEGIRRRRRRLGDLLDHHLDGHPPRDHGMPLGLGRDLQPLVLRVLRRRGPVTREQLVRNEHFQLTDDGPEQTVTSPATRARRCRKACFAIGRCAAGLF